MPTETERRSLEAAARRRAEAAERQKAEALRLVERGLKIHKAREKLLDFTEFMMPDPEAPNDHTRTTYEAKAFHRACAEALERVERGDIQQLIFCMPPRHGKTRLATVSFGAWLFGRHPAWNIAVGTYSDQMANDFGADTRAIIQSDPFKQTFPAFELRRGGTARDNMNTTTGGRMVFVGRGGALTGKGAHVLLLDDLYKDYEEARSQAIRNQAWDWFTKVAMTRRMGRKLVVITMCLTGDTPVSMADGSWKRLDEVVAGDEVVAWQDGEQVPRTVVKASAQGEDDVFEVRTGASRVRGNARHPFLVERNGCLEWVRLGDLRVGDSVVSSGCDDRWQRDDMDEEEAWSLGFMFGDGWVTRNAKRNKKRDGEGRCSETASWVSCVAECPKYPERVNRASAYLESRFGATFRTTRFGYRRTEKAALGRWLHSFGLGVGAKNKRVPPVIFKQAKKIRQAFLDGFMAADGHVRSKIGRQGHHRANGGYEVTQTLLANEDLVRDLRHLARSIGYPVTNICASHTVGKPPHSQEESAWKNWGFSYHNRKGRNAPFVTERVRSIKPAGRAVVYDLTVAGSENFIADGIVVHNTRWHSDDIIGRLTDPENPFYNAIEAAKWKIIRLPAVAEEDDDLGRAPGEPLWPERFDLDFLQSQQRIDPLGFASLYQQRPTVADGVLFRRETIQRYRREQLPSELRYYCASDHAVATGQRNDPSCFIKVGIDRQDNIWVVDCFWRKVPTDQAVEAMLAMGGGSTRPIVWWAEKGHISQSIGPFLRKRMQETGVYVNVREVTPVADKQTRAQSIAARCAAGKVYVPSDTSWGDRAVDEMLSFPNGTHDDFVDALAHIGNGLTTLVAPSAPISKKVEPKFGTLGWAKIQNRWQEQQDRARRMGGF